MAKATRQPREGFQLQDCEEGRALGQVCFVSTRDEMGKYWLALGNLGFIFKLVHYSMRKLQQGPDKHRKPLKSQAKFYVSEIFLGTGT